MSFIAGGGVSAGTQKTAFYAILFYYKVVRDQKLEKIHRLRPKEGDHKRNAPSRSKVREILRIVPDVYDYPTRLVTFLLYACGLRVNEPLNLRIKDVDLENGTLMIRQSKGRKDRIVRLPAKLIPALAEQISKARKVWQYDRTQNIPVALPGRMAFGNKNKGTYWQWFWVFPQRTPTFCRRSKTMVRCHFVADNVQKAVRIAAKKLELEGDVTPHCLRHSYATHLLDAGVKLSAVQEALGHQSIETTAIYDHNEPLSVPSPLEIQVPTKPLAGGLLGIHPTQLSGVMRLPRR